MQTIWHEPHTFPSNIFQKMFLSKKIYMMITRRERPDLGAAGMNGSISNPGHTDRRDAKEMICLHATYWFYTTLKSCTTPINAQSTNKGLIQM